MSASAVATRTNNTKRHHSNAPIATGSSKRPRSNAPSLRSGHLRTGKCEAAVQRMLCHALLDPGCFCRLVEQSVQINVWLSACLLPCPCTARKALRSTN
jgi:hypothetical protein